MARPAWLREQSVAIYPQPYRMVRARVRFGPEAIRVDAKLARCTPTAAGIEFRAGDTTFRCCVCGNAATVADA